MVRLDQIISHPAWSGDSEPSLARKNSVDLQALLDSLGCIGWVRQSFTYAYLDWVRLSPYRCLQDMPLCGVVSRSVLGSWVWLVLLQMDAAWGFEGEGWILLAVLQGLRRPLS